MPTFYRRPAPARRRRPPLILSALAARTGDSSITLGALTASATGVLALAGDASITLGALTSSATGALALAGDASVTLDALTLSAQGGATALTGDASVILGALTVEADGTLPLQAAATPTLGALTASADGTLPLQAAAAPTLAALTSSAAGTLPIAGDLAKTLGALTASASGAGSSTSWNVAFGEGYTDVSARQLVRTSDNRLYVVAMECDAYPYESGDRLFIKRASSTGIPSGYTDVSSGDHTDVNTVAIAIDGSDKIHILMPDRSGNLKYRVWLTSTDAWEAAAATIDTGLETNTGQGDQQAALALDSNGIPHICYLKSDGTRRRLYYRNRVGGSWSAAELVDDQSFGTNEKIWHPNIAFDVDGRRVFLWVRGSFNDTADGELFIKTRETNDTWNTTVMVSSANALLTSIDQSTSIIITPDNRYHVTWMNGSTTPANKYIRYAYSDDDGATWTRNDPGGGTQATHNPSLGYAAGSLRIFGHGTPDAGNHGENLYYFEGDGGGATWGSWTEFVTGTNYDSSVATRWSQHFYTRPGTWDVAYWDDNYPNLLYVGTSVVESDPTGDAAVTLGALTASAAGAVALAGTLTATLGSLSSSAAGTLPITGDAAVTLAALTVSAAGAPSPLSGDAAITLGALTASAAGTLPIVGDAAATLGALTSGATGGVAVQGTTAATLAALTLVAAGSGPITAVGIVRASITGRVPSATITAGVPSATIEGST